MAKRQKRYSNTDTNTPELVDANYSGEIEGMSTPALRCWQSASRAFQEGKFQRAQMFAMQGMDLVAGSHEPGDEMMAAMNSRVLLNVAHATEDFDTVLAMASITRQLFVRLGPKTYAAAVAEVDRVDAEAHWQLGDQPGAQRLIMQARKTFVKEGDHLAVAMCDVQRARMLPDTADHETARNLLQSARAVFAGAAQLIQVAQCDAMLGKYAQAAGRYDEAETLLFGAMVTMAVHNAMFDAARVGFALGELFTSQKRYSDAVSYLEMARNNFRVANHYPMIAHCDWQLAIVRRGLNDDAGALKSALAALATWHRQRYRMRNPGSREYAAKGYYGLVSLAVHLAGQCGDHRLVAELIESARGQGIPAESDKDQSPTRTEREEITIPPDIPPFAQPVWVDSLPFSQHRYVKVKGRSALRKADPSKRAHIAGTVELEKVARLLGGPNTWWWGTFQTHDSLWWSLINPKGSVEAGRIPFDPGSPAWRAVDELHEALPIPDGTEDDTDFTRRVARGALTDPDLEEALATKLGDALLPGPLKQQLAQANNGKPLSLVAAPCPALCLISLCALGIGDGRRLIEAAVIRYAPSAALAAEIEHQTRPQQRGRGGPAPVVAGLFDPDRTRPLLHASCLASAVAGEEALVAERATRSNLKEALARAKIRPGSAGVFVYSGHARTPHVPGVALLCLHHDDGEPQLCPMQNCCGGTPLTAAELYGQDPTDAAITYPMPGRVLLTACDTSGGSSVGRSGEWLALAPAMMWAGARMVVATSWPTLDDPRTLAMDIALVEILTTASDPAEELRKIQLDKLRMWRSGPQEKVPLSPIRGWSPLFWSPYIAVGFHST